MEITFLTRLFLFGSSFLEDKGSPLFQFWWSWSHFFQVSERAVFPPFPPQIHWSHLEENIGQAATRMTCQLTTCLPRFWAIQQQRNRSQSFSFSMSSSGPVPGLACGCPKFEQLQRSPINSGRHHNFSSIQSPTLQRQRLGRGCWWPHRTQRGPFW